MAFVPFNGPLFYDKLGKIDDTVGFGASSSSVAREQVALRRPIHMTVPRDGCLGKLTITLDCTSPLISGTITLTIQTSPPGAGALFFSETELTLSFSGDGRSFYSGRDEELSIPVAAGTSVVLAVQGENLVFETPPESLHVNGAVSFD